MGNMVLSKKCKENETKERTYKTITSMSNLFHSWTVKLFFSKESLSLKSLMNVHLS